MEHKVEIEYGGANLCLSLSWQEKQSERIEASLLINGILRDKIESTKGSTTLRLSSAVQTEYEWHEFIEAIVEFNTNSITASILASKAVLKEEIIEL